MINFSFDMPMKEAQAFWADKVQLGPGEFSRLSDEAKLRAFAVSGIAKGDELQTVFDSMLRAIDEGTTLEDFKEDCQTIFEKRGWTGKRAWRLDNIFRTNVQTAYHVGRYKEMQEVKKTRPFWKYDAVNDSRTRPTHAGLDGKIFHADHPFWDKWYPPNGFRCRCGVDTLSQDDIADEGLTVETEDPTGGLIEPVDPVTGEKMPARPLMPDRGFDHNPGKSYWGGGGRQGKMTDMPGLRSAGDYHRRSLANIRPTHLPDIDESMMLRPGLRDDEYIREFKTRYGESKVIADAAGDPVILSLRAFQDRSPSSAEWKFRKDGHPEIIPLLEDVVKDPYEIWLTPQKDEVSGRIRLTRRYFSVWKTQDKERIGGLMSFEVVRGEFQGVTSFVPLTSDGAPDMEYLERQRRGLLIYGKGK